MYLKFLIILFIINQLFSMFIGNKLIISLSSNKKNINILYKVINSILDQNISHTLYQIVLILSEKEIKGIFELPKELVILSYMNKIKIIFIKNKLNLQTRLLIPLKEYPLSPILIIGCNILFPEGWLEMFINDHKKYPNDILSSSIQYYFGKNTTIREFSEGYKGKYYGTFNHISNMVFNFAIINSDLGGTLFPPGIFKNKYFYNVNLFLKISKESDEFWQSCFIIIEDKSIRQTSKILDYIWIMF